jgi:hypothetical protein
LKNQPPFDKPNDCDEEHSIIVEANGDIVFVFDDSLHEVLQPAFPNLKTSRASHCEPSASGWSVDVSPLLGGPEQIIATARRRDEALAAEVDWLQQFLEGAPLEKGRSH